MVNLAGPLLLEAKGNQRLTQETSDFDEWELWCDNKGGVEATWVLFLEQMVHIQDVLIMYDNVTLN